MKRSYGFQPDLAQKNRSLRSQEKRQWQLGGPRQSRQLSRYSESHFADQIRPSGEGFLCTQRPTQHWCGRTGAHCWYCSPHAPASQAGGHAKAIKCVVRLRRLFDKALDVFEDPAAAYLCVDAYNSRSAETRRSTMPIQSWAHVRWRTSSAASNTERSFDGRGKRPRLRAESEGFDLAAHFLHAIVVSVGGGWNLHVGGIAQLVERLVRNEFGWLWTQKVLRGQRRSPNRYEFRSELLRPPGT